jgi:hypothetical protein
MSLSSAFSAPIQHEIRRIAAIVREAIKLQEPYHRLPEVTWDRDAERIAEKVVAELFKGIELEVVALRGRKAEAVGPQKEDA